MIPLAYFRKRLDLPAAADEDLRDILDTVVGLWEDTTKRLWKRREDHIQEFTFGPTVRQAIFLELEPIEEIVKVEERWALPGSTLEELASSSYLLVQVNQLLKTSGPWRPLVRVTYTGGYAAKPDEEAEIPQQKTPADVQEALILQAQFMQNRMGSEKIAIRSQNFEGGGGVYEDAFLHPYFAKLAAQKARVV